MSEQTGIAFIPDSARVFLRRRVEEGFGIVLLGLAAAYLVALLSSSGADPSLNLAVDGPVRNLLGVPGAYVADLMLESLGLAAFMLAAAAAIWGWQLLRHRPAGRWWLRLILLPVAVIAAAIGLNIIPWSASWPFGGGLGGFAGRLLIGGSTSVPGLAGLSGVPAWVLQLLGLVVAPPLYYMALGVSWRRYQQAGQRLAAASGDVGRGAGWLWRLLHRQKPESAAEYRAERYEQERPRRMEPRLEEHLLDIGEEEQEMPSVARPTIPVVPRPARDEDEPLVEPQKPRTKPGKRAARAGQATLDLVPNAEYSLPPLDLLHQPVKDRNAQRVNEESLEKNARLLETVLQDFGVRGQIVKVRPGPVVTLYELEPAPGTKTSRVVGLADDVARSMSAISVRIAVVPGQSVIGIELPNRSREVVSLRELLASDDYERTAAKLALVLGKDIGGAPSIVDLARMPHLLIAGTTGSGKSVAINTMILSLIYRLSPDQCKFIMVDPKMLELSVYDGIPHLLAPVVTDPRKAIVALKWTVREMENRYRKMSQLGVRNIEGYNQRVEQARTKGETLTRRVQTGFDPETGAPIYEEQAFDLSALPFIVVVVDEMADLMLVAGKEIEGAVQRLAQMARAAGIHIIMATQRPSVDVITGTIKANFPTRVSFHVTSRIDSRTILGEQGAEQLLGQGDMLYMAQGGRIMRVHGPFVTDAEVEQVVMHLKDQGQPSYIEDITKEEEEAGAEGLGASEEGGDDLYDKAVALVCRERKASTSFVQRHLQIGYNRAARLIERMEKEGVVSSANHVGKREVLARNIDGME
ncbi:MAG: segregation ATPase FtsK/SpoIIIE, family [Rhodospirillaceae bacterium]|nr:segregation ATPase FtsK/SpoIIIE, family [Rhodospirillaceae bacterium]